MSTETNNAEPAAIAGLPTSEPFLAERQRLPEHLRPRFDNLVEAYRFHAFRFYQRPFVSYKILAALVADGWRIGRTEGSEVPGGVDGA